MPFQPHTRTSQNQRRSHSNENRAWLCHKRQRRQQQRGGVRSASAAQCQHYDHLAGPHRARKQRPVPLALRCTCCHYCRVPLPGRRAVGRAVSLRHPPTRMSCRQFPATKNPPHVFPLVAGHSKPAHKMFRRVCKRWRHYLAHKTPRFSRRCEGGWTLRLISRQHSPTAHGAHLALAACMLALSCMRVPMALRAEGNPSATKRWATTSRALLTRTSSWFGSPRSRAAGTRDKTRHPVVRQKKRNLRCPGPGLTPAAHQPEGCDYTMPHAVYRAGKQRSTTSHLRPFRADEQSSRPAMTHPQEGPLVWTLLAWHTCCAAPPASCPPLSRRRRRRRRHRCAMHTGSGRASQMTAAQSDCARPCPRAARREDDLSAERLHALLSQRRVAPRRRAPKRGQWRDAAVAPQAARRPSHTAPCGPVRPHRSKPGRCRSATQPGPLLFDHKKESSRGSFVLNPGV